MRNRISDLTKALEERMRESTHLQELVARMEQSATNDEVIRTQMEDLKNELAGAYGTFADRFKHRWPLGRGGEFSPPCSHQFLI